MKNVNALAILLLVLVAGLLPASASGDLVMHLSGDGDALDQTANGHNGTLVNGVGFGTGELGQAFSFDGVDDFITVAPSSDLEPTDISVAFWVKASASGGIKLLVDSSHGSSNGPFGWAIQMGGNGRVGIAYGNGSSFPGLDSSTSLADDQFHHFAATLDGTNMRTYVDGVLDQTASYTGTPMGTGQQIRIGRHFSLNRQFSGLMDDIRIYNHALTGAEVQSLVAVPEPSACALLAVGAVGFVLRRRREIKNR